VLAGFVETALTRQVEGVDHLKMIKPSDVAEAAMLPFKTSVNCVPFEIHLSSATLSDMPDPF
jgi:hypothetical protein